MTKAKALETLVSLAHDLNDELEAAINQGFSSKPSEDIRKNISKIERLAEIIAS